MALYENSNEDSNQSDLGNPIRKNKTMNLIRLIKCQQDLTTTSPIVSPKPHLKKRNILNKGLQSNTNSIQLNMNSENFETLETISPEEQKNKKIHVKKKKENIKIQLLKQSEEIFINMRHSISKGINNIENKENFNKNYETENYFENDKKEEENIKDIEKKNYVQMGLNSNREKINKSSQMEKPTSKKKKTRPLSGSIKSKKKKKNKNNNNIDNIYKYSNIQTKEVCIQTKTVDNINNKTKTTKIKIQTQTHIPSQSDINYRQKKDKEQYKYKYINK